MSSEDEVEAVHKDGDSVLVRRTIGTSTGRELLEQRVLGERVPLGAGFGFHVPPQQVPASRTPAQGWRPAPAQTGRPFRRPSPHVLQQP